MLIPATAISVGIGLVTSAPAGALAHHGTGGTPAVTYVVSDTAQASARAFWTPARMSAATPRITRSGAVRPEVSA